MNKKCKVVMLATNKKEIGVLSLNTLRETNTNLPVKQKYLLSQIINQNGINNLNKYSGLKPQHLYILSDEEINANDWISDGKELWQLPIKLDGYINLFKVIATTDSFITGYDDDGQPMDKNGNIVKSLPSIPQSFIDKYVSEYNKGNKIEDVMVEYEPISRMKSGGIETNITELLKLNPDNTINIKSIKDSWTREEVIELCKTAIIVGSHSSTFDFDEWIESNL